MLNNEEPNYSLKHALIDFVCVADIRHTFYNVNNLYDLFTDVVGATILKCLKEMNLYTQIKLHYVLNIWFYPFNVSFICTYNPFVLWTKCFIFKGLVDVLG